MKLVHADMRLDFYSGGGGGGVGTLRLTARAMDESHAAFDLTSPSSSFDLTSSEEEEAPRHFAKILQPPLLWDSLPWAFSSQRCTC